MLSIPETTVTRLAGNLLSPNSNSAVSQDWSDVTNSGRSCHFGGIFLKKISVGSACVDIFDTRNANSYCFDCASHDRASNYAMPLITVRHLSNRSKRLCLNFTRTSLNRFECRYLGPGRNNPKTVEFSSCWKDTPLE